MSHESLPVAAVRRSPRRTARRALPFVVLAAALAWPAAAMAQGYAEGPRVARRAVVDEDAAYDDDASYRDRRFEPRPSLVRFSVGPAGKLDGTSASPGLLAAIDLGRGPAGVRLSGAWMDVGGARGLSQYTGELTVDFGGRSRFRPVLGAGGGVARTSSSVRDDGRTNLDQGATIGVGVVRAGLGVRLPFEDADARVGLDLTGTLAAIRGADAPDLAPWLVTSITVGLGF